MYKYTPKKSIIRSMGNRCGFPDYSKCVQIVHEHGLSSYMELVHFMYWYPGVEFYSKERRDSVPANGILFPVVLFDEEVV